MSAAESLAGGVWDAIPRAIFEAVEAGVTAEGPLVAMDRAWYAWSDALPDETAAACMAAMEDPGVVDDAISLATRLVAERDARRAAEAKARAEAAAAESERLFSVALVDGAIGNELTRVLEVPWRVLSKVMTTPRKADTTDKLKAPGWLPVRLKDGALRERFDANVGAVSCLVLDIDDGADLSSVCDVVAGFGLKAALHTTWSHRPDHHKARVVFPLSEDCPADRWLDTWKAAEAWSSGWGAHIDKTCKNTSRLYFMPALPGHEWNTRSAWFVGRVFAGKMLSWRWLQANHMPPPEANPLPPVSSGSWAGRTLDQLDAENRRKRKFALAVLENRCAHVRCAAPGKGQRGRNANCYTSGRAAGQLIAASVLDEPEALAALVGAAVDAGLSAAEARRAVLNGLNKGKEDGPWDFSTC